MHLNYRWVRGRSGNSNVDLVIIMLSLLFVTHESVALHTVSGVWAHISLDVFGSIVVLICFGV